MSLCIIVFTVSFIKVSGYNKIKNNIAVDEMGVSLVNFINNSRERCREEKGRVIFILILKKTRWDSI
ncbi:hypothetical protein JQ035_01990 [Clostridium botulinum]|nr:hypothetical protein [Clostridium botulinum]